VPVTPYRLCAYSDIDVLPVQELSYSGDAKAAVVKSRERSSFLNISHENHIIEILFPSLYLVR